MTASSVLSVVHVKNSVERVLYPVLEMSGYPGNRSPVVVISEWFLARL
jgi:hypothetical protein